jgi:hypothetical protein
MVCCSNNKEFNVFYTFESNKPSFSKTLTAFKCGDNEEFISNFPAEYLINKKKRGEIIVEKNNYWVE